VVLFDGAPVGYRGEGKDRVPRFPLLQKLREGAYRRYWFLARQPHAGFLFALKSDLPAGVLVYPHDEQVNLLCRTCASAGRVEDDVPNAADPVVMGKLIVPEWLVGPSLVERLDEVLADRALVSIPELYEELGDAARARRDLERWDDLAAARNTAKPESCGHRDEVVQEKKWWQVWK
jgi:hypothetical protein